MDSANALQTYVQEQLQNGLNHQQILSQLLASGWTAEQLELYAPYLYSSPQQTYQSAQPTLMSAQIVQPLAPQIVNPTITPDQSQNSTLPAVVQSGVFGSMQLDSAPVTRTSRKKRPMLIIISLAAVLLLVLAGYFMFNRDTSGTLKSFKDPNFSMQLPSGWHTDRGYEAGKTLVIAYSPENAQADKKEQAAQLTVYVGIGYDRADEQISYLKDSGAQFEIIKDDSFETEGVQYRLIEYTSKHGSTSALTHTLMVNAKRGDFLINADIVAPDEVWQTHASHAETVLRSIVPGCDNIYGKNEVFKDVSLLCSN